MSIGTGWPGVGLTYAWVGGRVGWTGGQSGLEREVVSRNTHFLQHFWCLWCPSTIFHSTSLYYSSTTSTIISKYLCTSPSTMLSSHSLLFFPLSFLLLFQYLCQTDLESTHSTNDPYVFYSHLCLFLSLFLSSFSILITLAPGAGGQCPEWQAVGRPCPEGIAQE